MKRKIFIILFFISSFSFSQDIKIISSDQSRIVIQYIPESTDTLNLKGIRDNFVRLVFSGTSIDNAGETGMPEIPVKILNLGVPSEYGSQIKIISEKRSQINGMPAPVPELSNNEGLLEERYIKNENYNNFIYPETIMFGNFGYAASVPVQQVKIYPMTLDNSGKISILKEIIFEVVFSGSGSGVKIPGDDLIISGIINCDAAKNWGKVTAKKSYNKINASADLSSGNWYKFTVGTEGIYKISKNMLQSYGIPADVDPRTIKIFNNGGYQLPEDVDLDSENFNEIAIKVVGEEDGVFNDNDYILFYARTTNFVDPLSNGNLKRVYNHFSKSNYYFITSGGNKGKRMQVKSSVDTDGFYEQTVTNNLVYYEIDNRNIGKSGRMYLGEDFTSANSQRTFINTLSGRIPGTSINYSVQMVNASQKGTLNLKMYENESLIKTGTIISTSASINGKYKIGIAGTFSFTSSMNLPSNRSMLRIACESNSELNGYLDYFEIQYKRDLSSSGDSVFVFGKDTTAAVKYKLTNFTNTTEIRVYDITDYANVMEISSADVSGGDFSFTANETEGVISKYFGTSTAKYRSPGTAEKVKNSYLKSETSGAEYIIITPAEFETQSQRLKTYRGSNSNKYPVTSKVVLVEEIFNEFGCGQRDPSAIRNFIRYAFENWSVKPKHVLLMGDGTYDYFNAEGKNNNFIPTYQTIETLYELSSYGTDDYYVKVAGNDKFLDLTIGRFPINSAEEADNLISKIINYEKDITSGIWRNKISLVADDNYTFESSSEDEHTTQCEDLSRNIPDFMEINKIYLATYPLEETGAGKRRPEVTKAIINAVNDGTLIMNFVGHGSPDVWTHEYVLTRSKTIPEFNNDKLFFLVAATCDFAKFDFTDETSGAEMMLLKENTGAVGVFAATRKAYSSYNAALNKSFFTTLLNQRDIDYNRVTLGQASVQAKNANINSSLINTSVFHLLCDPYLRLNIPVMPVEIDSLNGSSLSSNVQLKALSHSKIKGKVIDKFGNIDQNFSGEAYISVYDARTTITIPDFMGIKMVKEGGAIFKGRVNVVDGFYEADFIVPKDISYTNSNGKMVVYVYNESTDGIGFTKNVIIGGSDSTATDDKKGPDVNIYFDDTKFENAYLVNQNFKLIVDLSDETGLNTTGLGIGHKIEATLNNDIKNSIDLSNYFSGDLNSGGKSGKIEYNFIDMPVGNHTLSVKAWDVFNNLTIEDVNFTVVSNESLAIKDVYNYPNPFSDKTLFTFQHNISDFIDVKIKIYTIAGRLIKEIEQNQVLDKFVKIDWDGRDEDGDLLANGTYLYKLIIKTGSQNETKSVLGKLAVIR
ncbi:MAG: type IX secretion system sortase PorU [Ignavibacteria bacterium]|nr:type IX secretion system sortase PorU [Ignavibacteria bacterium]